MYFYVVLIPYMGYNQIFTKIDLWYTSDMYFRFDFWLEYSWSLESLKFKVTHYVTSFQVLVQSVGI